MGQDERKLLEAQVKRLKQEREKAGKLAQGDLSEDQKRAEDRQGDQ